MPELASRDHVRKLLPLVRETLHQAGLGVRDLGGVAYTAGPGLVGALLVGASAARAMAWALEVPAIGVHHMEGHLLAPLLEADPPEPPFVALLVSGGHSMLVAVRGIGDYEVLGDTLDDAAGEAFDKTAKLMGLPYPGGPALAAEALKGDPGAYRFARPMTDRPGLDFSFSGLKTQVLLAWDRSDQSESDPRRHRQRLRAGDRRHPGHQVPARAGGHRPVAPGGRRRGWRQPAPARAAGRGRQARRFSRVFPAPGVLHRQWRDDRAGRRHAPGRRAGAGAGDPRPPALALWTRWIPWCRRHPPEPAPRTLSDFASDRSRGTAWTSSSSND